ncbi:hypothetical protein [Undibacterium pigrum]|uniref:Uncharacterized protein n=1 Tax=Undibacterium pigrum TaxID=401470 RepID=A0A318J2X8_9BURK|nr:hypothetical protein [Undibacterium pigrum]PXX41493.1 hypothetical protein DFR42_107144 [Undibacterium pigrum]
MPSVHPVKSAGALNTVKAPVIKSILISLLRQSEHVIALLGDEVDGVLQPALRRVNLAELDTSLFPQTASLLDDWHSLQNAHDLAGVWPAFWRVFWMTVPDADNIQMPVMPQTTVHKKPVATAAHPRAFRGTKYQPPKPALPVLDLCKWLTDQRLLDAFFAQHDFTALPALDAQGQIIPLPESGLISSATLFFNHWKTPVQALPVLPDGFRRHFLWSLRACSVDQQLAWLQIWHRHHSMHADDVHRIENLGLLARLCALYPSQCHAAELAQVLPVSRQNIFLRLLIQEVQGQLSSSQMSMEQLIRLHELTEVDARFEYYLGSILRNLSRKVSVEYSLTGCLLFEISGETELDKYRLAARQDCQDVPVEAIARFCKATASNSWVSLWDMCARLTGMAQLLRETQWEQFSQQAAETWIYVFYDFIDEDKQGELQAKWQVYLKLFSQCHDVLITLPADRQNKLASMWKCFVDGWDDVQSLAKAAHDFLPLMHQLCLPPFSSKIDYGYSFLNIVETWPEKTRQEILALDSRVWRQLEHACRREDKSKLLAYGTHAIASVTPSLLRTSFMTAPVRFFKTACLLGSLHYERRQLFMKKQENAEWFTEDWHAMSPLVACQRLLALSLATGLDSPLPRRLREHLEGRLDLSPRQIARHCKLTLSRLPAMGLRALEAALWQEMDAQFQLRDTSASARHALRLLAGMDDFSGRNRRGLRRFLHNARDGKLLDYRQHPLNQAWHARHTRVQQTAWHAGLLRTVPTAQGELTLAFEHDPFEVLMMGSYAGTCLGIGGLCDYSVVSCLLDANKQVLYARNSEGRVVARQLLAIDEADQLVCFAVYPDNISQEVKAAFKSYDQELAAQLGLSLYQDREESSYDITTVLAQDWWDDGPWQEELCRDDEQQDFNHV